MSPDRLLDRPIPELVRALSELRRIRQLPADVRGTGAQGKAEAAVISVMIKHRVARCQCRLPTGELVHVKLALPAPKLSANFDVDVQTPSFVKRKRDEAAAESTDNVNANPEEPTP